MRIALLSPKGPLYRHRGGVFRRSLRYAPLTLPTLVALAPPELEIEWSLVDEGIEDVPADLDADLVGMTVITGTATRAYALAAELRERGIPVVLGGPHVTLAPEDAAPHADAIVTGYAEDTWPELLRDFARGCLQVRYEQAEELSLAGRPWARRDLVDGRRYTTTHVFEASRACVHACEFCVVPSAWGRKPFLRPPAEVVEEVRSTGARKALFLDLNLIADRAWAAQLFEALLPLGIQWYGLATVLLADDAELLALAARSGCRGLLVGFESIAPGSLRGVRKGFADPARYHESVRRFHAAGIALQGTFVFGLDGEGPNVFRDTANFAVEARIDLPRFALATPFPGTPLFARLEREGRLLTRNWELFDGQHAVFQPEAMSPMELERGNSAAWRAAYSWSGMARRLAGTPAPRSLALGANLGYRFYGRRLERFATCDRPLAVERGRGRRRRARVASSAAAELSRTSTPSLLPQSEPERRREAQRVS